MKLYRLCCIFLLLLAAPVFAAQEKIEYGRFGAVILDHTAPRPARVAILISGSEGWTPALDAIAGELQSMDTLVIGVDARTYLRKLEDSKAKCNFPAVDLDALSKFVQRKLGYTSYVLPVLIGYGAGSGLAYASMSEAPPTTFGGAVSLGFCAHLKVTHPFCKASGLESKRDADGAGYTYLPAKKLEDPWIVLEGKTGEACVATPDPAYRAIQGSSWVQVPEPPKGSSFPQNWIPQIKQAYSRIFQPRQAGPGGPVATQAVAIKDLPIVEVAATGGTSPYFAVIISGDGGWAGIDREIGAALAADGVPVAGWNSLQYFWTERTPDSTAADLVRILKHYTVEWKKEKVLLIGYSFGAEVLPFLVRRLPPDLAAKVGESVLISATHHADFEFHVTDWLNSSQGDYPVLPELEKLKDAKVLCIYGDEEEDSLCRGLDPKIAKSLELKGGHHLGGDYPAIAAMILKELK